MAPCLPLQSPSRPDGVWALALDSSSDLIALLDARGCVLWANATLSRATGRELPQLIGRPLHEAFKPAGASSTWQRLCELGEAGPAESGVLELADFNWHDGAGGSRCTHGRLTPLNADHTAGDAAWLCVLVERTEFHRLQSACDADRKRLRAVQEGWRIGMWTQDLPDGAYLMDRHMRALWGLDTQDETPPVIPLAEALFPEERTVEVYFSSLKAVGVYSHRHRLKRPDGGIRHVHARWEVHGDEHGTPVSAIGVQTDDTEVYALVESLNAANHQLSMAVELGNVGLWRRDVGTERVVFNERGRQILGLPPMPDGMALAQMRELIHPDDRARVDLIAQQSDDRDVPVDVVARYRHGDGGWRHIHTRRLVVRDPDGNIIEFMGLALDVTEQMERVRHADALTRRLEATATAAGLGMWSHKPATGQTQWNAQMFALTGRRPEHGGPTLQQWLDDIVHPDDRDAMQRAHHELAGAMAHATSQLEYRVRWPDGQVRWLLNRSHNETTDGSVMFVGVTIDITERVRTEAELRQAHERIALAVHGAGIGTWERDVKHDTVRWDAQMYLLRGIAPQDESSSANALRYELAHPDDIDNIVALNKQSVRDRTMCTYEFRVRMPDGSYRWLASRSIPIVDKSGEVVRQLGVNWDVHERVTAEAERQDKLVAQRESQAKSEFLARMSHELRTPLNAVLGFTQLLQLAHSSPLNDDQRTKLDHIRSAGEHLLSLINDVLDLSSLESGQLKLDLQPVPLADVLREAMALVEPTARRAGVMLRVEPMDVVLKVDRIRARQVLINLLSNGIKYNRARGRVTVSAHAEGDQVVMQVKDTGRGMTAEQLAHLFEPFNRLGMEREGIEGVGMGLAVVKALVERMGGAVNALSEPHVGSHFEVRLPRDAPEADAATESAANASANDATPPSSDAIPAAQTPDTRPAPSPRGRPSTGAPPAAPTTRQGQLLYIEDNPVNVLLVEELVRTHAGLSITSEVTGIDGVKRARALRPDLILIDMQLPDIHGFEVLRRLRHDPETAHIPCIALSANAMPDDIARATEAGFSDYWTKPINFAVFLKALDGLFPAA